MINRKQGLKLLFTLGILLIPATSGATPNHRQVPDTWELELIQDYTAEVGYTELIEFNITNQYTFDRSADVFLKIYDPNTGLNTTLFEMYNWWVSPYTEHYNQVPVVFNATGHYDVYLELYDVNATSWWSTTCYFDVYEPNYDYWQLQIWQENYVTLNQPTSIEFNVTNMDSIGHLCDIKLRLYNPNTDTNQILYDQGSIYLNGYAHHWNQVTISFSTPGYYDVYLEVYDHDTDLWWDTHCWYEVSEEQIGFDLWIEQEYEVIVGAETWIYFGFNNGDLQTFDGSVELLIIDSEGYSETIFYDEIVLYDYSDYSNSVGISFTAAGHYEVRWIVENFIDGEVWEQNCWFEVSWLESWLVQDNIVSVNQETYIDIFITNFDIEPHQVQIDLMLHQTQSATTDPVLIYSDSVSIEGNYTHSVRVQYVFYDPGMYDVELIVYDETDDFKSYRWCWFGVYQEEGLGLMIFQPFSAMIGQELCIDAIVDNYYTTDHMTQVTLELILPGGSTKIISDENVTLFSFDRFSQHIHISLDESGQHVLLLRVYDYYTGLEWLFECGIDAFSEEANLNLSLGQQNYVAPGQETIIDFSVKNNYPEHHQCSIQLVLIDKNNAYQETVLFDSTVGIEASGVFSHQITYKFDYSGYWDVELRVHDLNTGMDWMIPCWFEVSDEVTGFTIWIDPEGGIQLGQETKFEFGVINNQFDVFEGKVELLLYHPDDTRETLLSDEIQLIKNVEYVNSISIAFNEPGKYLVVLYVEDLQSDESWTEKYDITLYEGSTDITETKTDTETEPKTQDTSEESVTPPAVIPGFESLFALVALCILIPVIKRKRN